MVDLRKRYGHKIITLDQITKVIGGRPCQKTVTGGVDDHLLIRDEPRETIAPR